MFNLVRKFKREFVYISYLFLVLELLVTPSFVVDINYFFLASLIGYVLIIVWLINTFKLNAFKKVSKYSQVLLKVNIVDRLFSYVFLPLLLYSSLVAFLLFSSSSYMNQIVIVVSLVLFFYLFLYVRTSYERVFSINKMTRVVYDFISVAVFFLLTSVVVKSGLGDIWVAVITFFVGLLSFVYVLVHHRKLELQSGIVSLVAASLIAISSLVITSVSFNAKASIISIAYYLVISVFNVRFSGARKISDYIPPLMFSIMALILVLSL